MTRVFLLATAIVFAGFGFWGFLRPADMVAKFGIILSDPSGRTLIRASYGGFLIGAGLLFGWSALASERYQAGLTAIIALTLPILVSRLLGMVIDGSSSTYHLAYAGIEFIGVVGAFVLLRNGAA